MSESKSGRGAGSGAGADAIGAKLDVGTTRADGVEVTTGSGQIANGAMKGRLCDKGMMLEVDATGAGQCLISSSSSAIVKSESRSGIYTPWLAGPINEEGSAGAEGCA
jgi:hypothetical protein